MKKVKLFLIMFCCILILGTGVEFAMAFSSDPMVRYDGRKKELSFLNITGKDLFLNLKEAVPGDKVCQEIRVRVDRSQKKTDMYLSGKSVDGVKLPETIKLKVYQGKTLISEGSLNEQGNLKDGVRLHRFIKDEEIELQVVLEIPDSVGNEIANLRKEIQWIFTVNEYEGTDASEIISAEVPKTEDRNQMSVQFLLAAAGLWGVIWLEKKRKW